MAGPAYRRRLAAGVADAAAALADPAADPAAGLPSDRVRTVHDRWTACLDAHALAVEARAARLVDGHGDLRPEHVCLIDPPAIIDCLEFDADLRRLDPAAELSLLEVETARLGDPDSGRRLRRRCLAALDDAPPAPVRALYRAEQALVRARLAVGRRSDPGTGRTAADWIARATAYLDLAEAALADAALADGAQPDPPR
jgi:aminoglycoside phosphotransferase family enzyme